MCPRGASCLPEQAGEHGRPEPEPHLATNPAAAEQAARSPSPSASPRSCSRWSRRPSSYGWDDYSFSSANEDKLVTLINQARASAGLPALSDNNALPGVARWRSKDMWDRNYFSHSIPNPPGGDVFDELRDRDICYTVAGENIGVNNYPDDQTAQDAFNGWMNSSGHRALILGSGFNRVGIGAFKGDGSEYPKKYCTGVFSHGCGSSATPTPHPTPTPKPDAEAHAQAHEDPRPTPTADAANTPQPTATPHATPKPTPRPTPRDTDEPDDTPEPTPRDVGPTPRPTPEATPEITAEPIDPTADSNRVSLDVIDDGWGIGAGGPVDVPTPDPVQETVPPSTEAPSSADPPGGDGDTLQVIEPPTSRASSTPSSATSSPRSWGSDGQHSRRRAAPMPFTATLEREHDDHRASRVGGAPIGGARSRPVASPCSRSSRPATSPRSTPWARPRSRRSRASRCPSLPASSSPSWARRDPARARSSSSSAASTGRRPARSCSRAGTSATCPTARPRSCAGNGRATSSRPST